MYFNIAAVVETLVQGVTEKLSKKRTVVVIMHCRILVLRTTPQNVFGIIFFFRHMQRVRRCCLKCQKIKRYTVLCVSENVTQQL